MRTGKLLFSILALAFLAWVISTQDSEVLGFVSADAAETITTNADALQNISQTMGFFVTFLQFFAFIAFYFLQFLTDPYVITGEIFGAESTLNIIWQVSRDIMNVIFAFLLITGALIMTITAKKDLVGQYAVKLALAVILVNFSWFFPRVILDAGNVLAATIYNIPDFVSARVPGGITCEVWKGNKTTKSLQPCKYIKQVFFLDDVKTQLSTPVSSGGGCDRLYLGEMVCVKEGPLSDSNTAYGVLNGLVYNYGRLGELAIVPKSGSPTTTVTRVRGISRVEDFLKFLLFTGSSLLVSALLFIPLAAMVALFVIRIPIIWITIAFMPFMFVGFIIGDRIRVFNSMTIFKTFIAAAFLPAALAIPFSIGYIMIQAMQATRPTFGKPMFGLEDTDGILYNVPSMWDILWLLITFFVIWKGFFTAAKINETFGNIASKFESVGKGLGRFALAAPLAIPLLPTPGGGKPTTLGDVKAAIENPSVLFEKGKIKDIKSAAGGGPAPTIDDYKSRLGASGSTTQVTINDRVTNIINGRDVGNSIQDIEHTIGTKFTSEEHVKNFVRALKEKGLGVTGTQEDKILQEIRRARNF